MAGVNTLFSIGRSALQAYQRALTITGHNVANVNTPGYTRQEVVLTENSPQEDGAFVMGTGVQTAAIRRSFDGFIESQLTGSQQRLGRYEAFRQAVSQTQGYFQDANGQGINAALSDFFNSIEDVASNPADLSSRTVLLSRAQALAARFNSTAVNLQAQRRSLDGQISQTVDEVNHLSSQIAELNGKIRQMEGGGQSAADLRDQRGTLINDLAQRVDVTALEDSSGQVTVFVGRGQTLVSQGTAYSLRTTSNPGNSGFVDVEYLGEGPAPITLSPVIQEGRLKGLLDARDKTIPDLLARLDTLAETLVTQTNQIHQAGFGLDGSTGVDLFSAGGTAAGTMSVALLDARKIAASSTAAGVPGNNANALALAGLQSQSQITLGNTTVGDFYTQIATGIGTSAENADRDLKAQEVIQEQLQAHRAEVSGVSLDEELVNMMQYQRAFEAASRVVVMTDELFQTILSMKQ